MFGSGLSRVALDSGGRVTHAAWGAFGKHKGFHSDFVHMTLSRVAVCVVSCGRMGCRTFLLCLRKSSSLVWSVLLLQVNLCCGVCSLELRFGVPLLSLIVFMWLRLGLPICTRCVWGLVSSVGPLCFGLVFHAGFLCVGFGSLRGISVFFSLHC